MRLAIAVVSVLLGLHLLVYFIAGVFVSGSLNRSIDTSTDGSYRLQIGKLRGHLLWNTLSIDSLKVQPTRNASCEQYVTVQILAPKVRIRNLIGLILFGQGLEESAIQIERARIDLFNPKGMRPAFLQKKEQETVPFSFKGLTLENSRLRVFKSCNSGDSVLLADTVNIRVHGLKGTRHGATLGEMMADIRSIRYLASPVDLLSAESLFLSQSDSVLRIRNFQMRSLLDCEDYAAEKGFQTDCVNGSAALLEWSGIDWSGFVNGQALLIRSGLLADVHMDFYRDKRIPYIKKEKKDLPQYLLAQIPFQFRLSKLDLQNWDVTYSERIESEQEAGTIRFGVLNGQMLNISNIWNADSTLVVSVESGFNDLSRLIAKFSIPLVRESRRIDFYANMAPFNLHLMDPSISKLSDLRILDGKLEELRVNGYTDGRYSTGEVQFLYHDLRVRVESRRRGIAGLMDEIKTAFSMSMLKSDNPGDNGEVRPGQIDHERVRYKSVFNHLFKSAWSGMSDAMGVPFRQENPGIE